MNAMQIKKSYLFLAVFLLTGLWHGAVALAADRYPEGTPTRAIQDLDTMLSEYIIAPETDEERAFNRRLKKKALNGTFDIRSLAALSMDKHWEEISVKEQNYFVDVLSQLLERKAVFAKEQGGGNKKKGTEYTVIYRGHTMLTGKDKGRSLVQTWVNIPSENLKISLNYKMHEVDIADIKIVDPIVGVSLPVPAGTPTSREWRIYDVIVDDASLLDNYRYQFDAIIRKGGYADLIRRMESKLKNLQEQDLQEEGPGNEPA